jgi:hypothetical protein
MQLNKKKTPMANSNNFQRFSFDIAKTPTKSPIPLKIKVIRKNIPNTNIIVVKDIGEYRKHMINKITNGIEIKIKCERKIPNNKL